MLSSIANLALIFNLKPPHMEVVIIHVLAFNNNLYHITGFYFLKSESNNYILAICEKKATIYEILILPIYRLLPLLL